MNDTALYDKLIGALVGLARAVETDLCLITEPLNELVKKCLKAAGTESGKEQNELALLIEEVHLAKANVAPDCAKCTSPCGRTNDYDMKLLRGEKDDDIKNSKLRIISLLHNISALGKAENNSSIYLYSALCAVGSDYNLPYLQSIEQKGEEILNSGKIK